ncbi:MAG TPA: cell envelope integrity protein CreD [Chitinophagaceae bacterium]
METIENSIWQKSKLLIKGIIIGVLVLLLLIPAYFVQNLIKEREERQKEAVTEVNSKWAGRQNIIGPVLVIPYRETIVATDGKVSIVRNYSYLLPDKLDIKSDVTPQKKHRGIYDVMLYSSGLSITGKYSFLPLAKMKLTPADMLWNEAYVCFSVSDSRGLKDEIQFKWNDTLVTLNPSYVNNAVMKDGFSAPLSITEADIDKGIQFSTRITLNGSEQLSFTPVGKETNVELRSDWPDPSFTGNQLPDTSSVNGNGFIAKWRSLSHTRNFPQQWKNDTYNLSAAAFNADLFIPVSSYQKTMRSIKYAILCILLTFTAFFLIETTNKKSVHPVHYALIGFALILFYTLLLSFSEYTGFNAAYSIAAIATAGLITWFVKGLLGSMKLSMLLSFVLVLLYSYVFTILQLQDYALLLGSIGLFLTLAVVMYFSRKIQW